MILYLQVLEFSVPFMSLGVIVFGASYGFSSILGIFETVASGKGP
jgi:hypothetical protein